MQPGTAWSVLVIEDSADTAQALTQLLRGTGASVVSTASAGEALKVAATRSFDVILTDLGLPDIPGDVVIRHIIQTAARRPRVVVMTGHDESWQQRAREAGADAVLAKPLNWADLLVAMRGSATGIPVVSPTKAA
jgi:hypothetical protein